jgi:hypothetical protein
MVRRNNSSLSWGKNLTHCCAGCSMSHTWSSSANPTIVSSSPTGETGQRYIHTQAHSGNFVVLELLEMFLISWIPATE